MTPSCQVLTFRGCLLSRAPSFLRPPPHPTPICALTRCKKMRYLETAGIVPQPWALSTGLSQSRWPEIRFSLQPLLFAFSLLPLGLWGRGPWPSLLVPSDGPAVGTRGRSPAAGAGGGHVGQARSFRYMAPRAASGLELVCPPPASLASVP